MILKILSLLAMAALVAAVPLAVAQDGDEHENNTRPDDAAWVDDCPPDMMCAMSAPADDAPTHSGDCGGEVCAFDDPANDEAHVTAPEGSEAGVTSAGEPARVAFSVPVAGFAVALGALGLVAAAVRR